MIKTYKIFSILLSYPDEELQDFLKEVIPNLRDESLLEESKINEVNKFIDHYSHIPVLEWQEQYVQLFDFSRTASLHLFEHVHGDSRDRGQAMVDLTEEYQKAGVSLKSNELPDYLPVFLEYLSLLNEKKAAEFLTETVHILATLHFRLKEKDHPYAGIFSALMSLSEKPADENLVREITRNQKPVDFDKEYSDPEVTFNSNENQCNNCH